MTTSNPQSNSNLEDQKSIDTQVLRNILINLVTEVDNIKITREINEQGVLLSVSVGAPDMGIVIGRNGGMAMAINTLMRAIGKAHNMNIRVQFLEPDGSSRYAGKDAKTSFSGNRNSAPPRYNNAPSGNPDLALN